MTMMHVAVDAPGRDGAVRVGITGQVDGGSGALVDACIATACRASSPVVVVDLSAVTSLDPSAVRALSAARDMVEAAGRQFVLTCPSPRVAQVLRFSDPSLAACLRSATVTERALRVVPDTPAPPVDKDELVHTHRALANRLAQRFAGRGQPIEDLRQVANLGLVTAAKRFDPTREVQFATFAQATIVGELKKYFRDHSWQLHVARPVQELYLAVRAASEEITQRVGRTPTPAELAVHLGVTEEQVVESLEARSALHVDSLDRPRDSDDDSPWHEQSSVEDGYRVIEERSWLIPALQTLPERQRTILKLRFFDGLPQSAIATEIGISQMHVSRLLAKSLETLRAAANE
jgi:RNA polymerase sigma-B factor